MYGPSPQFFSKEVQSGRRLAWQWKMAASTWKVLPLWRIHNFSTGAGGTVKIVNISRPDTIALLTNLSGGHGPMWAKDKLALAVNFSTGTLTLTEATLVRIKDVSASEKPGVYNAELLVLCQARICEVSDGGSHPTAKIAPDLAPLWRIHHVGLVGDPTFDAKQTEIQIQNIAREDTLAILKKLGGGDVLGAKGHMVIVCDYKAKMVAGLRALLVRIGDITSKGDKVGPPYNCTLKCLGHIRCANVEVVGPFPQVLLDDVPVWRIHNLDANSDSPVHRIVNIGRPDSVALLKYLGQGNPLAATGGLVIGCNYTTPPAVGESGRLMRVSSINQATGEKVMYEAVLVDVSGVSVGKYISNEGKPENWWPRITVVLPKIWNMPLKSTGPIVRAPTPAVRCPYWMRCKVAFINLMCNTGLEQTIQQLIDPIGDKCFCRDCHKLRGDQLVYQRGGQPYAVPISFARVGVKPSKTHSIIERGMKDWNVCFHGTKHDYLGDIILQGQLLAPGSTLHNGKTIAVREGHIKGTSERVNEHTGKKEMFNPTNKVFFSPSVKYCTNKVYANVFYCEEKSYRFALQLRIQPNTYAIGQQTIRASEQIDQHFPNKSIEWYTEQLHTHFFTGILIQEQ